MKMNAPLHASQRHVPYGRHPGHDHDGRPRSVLISTDVFNRLQLFQKNLMPSPPRLDMRYLLDGSVALLLTHADAKLRGDWLTQSTNQMLKHAQQQLRLGQSGAVGAHREQGGSEAQRERHGDCKSLQIAEATFAALKAKQDTTEPRLGTRYLAEGALEVLMQRRELLQDWFRNSCNALRVHLDAVAPTT